MCFVAIVAASNFAVLKPVKPECVTDRQSTPGLGAMSNIRINVESNLICSLLLLMHLGVYWAFVHHLIWPACQNGKQQT